MTLYSIFINVRKVVNLTFISNDYCKGLANSFVLPVPMEGETK